MAKVRKTPNTQSGNLIDKQVGSNDSWSGTGEYFGDARYMYDYSIGGNDTLTGGGGAANYLYGDAYSMYGFSKGGNDVLTGAAGFFAVNYLYGDAYEMYDSSKGGDDKITGALCQSATSTAMPTPCTASPRVGTTY